VLLQGRVEIVDDTTHDDRMSVEVLKRAGSVEHLDEIVVRHHQTVTDDDQLTVTIRVVRNQLFCDV